MEVPLDDKKEFSVSYRTESELSLSSLSKTDRKRDPFALFNRLYAKTNDWRFGVLVCAVSTFSVFLINLIVTIWAAARYGSNGGEQILFEGDCGRAGRLNTALHLAINVLGTILLSSSNFCMQCLSAPTRREVDKAHAKGQWLDIGILSTRNLKGISKKRATMWWILGASSLPLHLFYNSVVFSSIVSNITEPYQVTSAFVDAGPSSEFFSTSGCLANQKLLDSYDIYNFTTQESCVNSHDVEADRLRKVNARSGMEKLDNLDCINAYAQQYQTRGNLLAVVENTTAAVIMPVGNGLFYGDCGGDGHWVCYCSGSLAPPCDMDPMITDIRANPADWKPLAQTISYCLAERVPEKCKVQSSLHLAVVVIILNFVKAMVMLILGTQTKETPFMTVGDAIASYIEMPDDKTRDMCLVSKAEIITQRVSWVKESRFIANQRHRLFAAASKARWAFCFVMYSLIIILIGALLGRGIHIIKNQYDADSSTLWKLGVGKASTMTTISYNVPDTGAAGLIFNSLVANVAQPTLSFMYFMYNGLFTAMSGAMEWESFFRNRKGLRVSGEATGSQRSTYFLTLPYRFGIPLMALSSVLHWLVSQSIFLVNIDYHEYSPVSDAWVSYRSEFTCGYSPMAIIFTIVAGGLMMVGIAGFSAIRLSSNMPVVANCSVAIAAACHTPVKEREEGANGAKLQWGVTGYDQNGVGHCAFSASPVEPPDEDHMYH